MANSLRIVIKMHAIKLTYCHHDYYFMVKEISLVTVQMIFSPVATDSFLTFFICMRALHNINISYGSDGNFYIYFNCILIVLNFYCILNVVSRPETFG